MPTDAGMDVLADRLLKAPPTSPEPGPFGSGVPFSDLELDPPYLDAWCHLREAQLAAKPGCGASHPRDTTRDIIVPTFDIREVLVSRTVIDLDDDLVADVAKALGTSTKKETVNTALREVLESRRRALALARLRASAGDGAFDLELFENKENYRR